MAKSDEVKTEPLTDEQRIAALEARVGTNKIVLLIVALVLIVVISVSVTAITLSAIEEEVEVVEVETVSELQQQVSQLSTIIETLNLELANLKKKLLVTQDQLESTSNLKLLELSIEEEQANQAFLESLRTGVYDLAHMVPGSRTWLEVYGEKVDDAIAHSQRRESTIKQVIAKEDSQDDDSW